ncbi:hypothetical protein L2725_06790 [Shewanella corallii]|uniref:Uncharacterized protein n=1 Tax=Shewanella corallii TaxID=560080 RepID=A0ABT0N5U1_9GAMM|nr:hypothetical protein [Shewanella corallii]MCL2913495.1 hypothetical protein [Shewanella corallii]
MLPRLHPGEYLLAMGCLKVRPGDVCLLLPTHLPMMVKTCRRVLTSGNLEFDGESAASITADRIGIIPPSRVCRVILVLGPKGFRRP